MKEIFRKSLNYIEETKYLKIYFLFFHILRLKQTNNFFKNPKLEVLGVKGVYRSS